MLYVKLALRRSKAVPKRHTHANRHSEIMKQKHIALKVNAETPKIIGKGNGNYWKNEWEQPQLLPKSLWSSSWKMSLAAAIHPDGQTTWLIGNPSICLIWISSTHQLRERLQAVPKGFLKWEAPSSCRSLAGNEPPPAGSQWPLRLQVQWSPMFKYHIMMLKKMLSESCRPCIPCGWAEVLCLLSVWLNSN